jgi:hypothetical protein
VAPDESASAANGMRRGVVNRMYHLIDDTTGAFYNDCGLG